MFGIPKRDEGAPPAPRQHLSPIGDACSRMDLQAIYQILLDIGYSPDRELATELSFQEWTELMMLWCDAKRHGDFAFEDKRFEDAIECYTEAIDVFPALSPTVYARRSLCHLICGQLDAALGDAVEAGRLHPTWPTALYMQAVALESNMQSGAMNTFNKAVTLEEKRARDKERQAREDKERRARDREWRVKLGEERRLREKERQGKKLSEEEIQQRDKGMQKEEEEKERRLRDKERRKKEQEERRLRFNEMLEKLKRERQLREKEKQEKEKEESRLREEKWREINKEWQAKQLEEMMDKQMEEWNTIKESYFKTPQFKLAY